MAIKTEILLISGVCIASEETKATLLVLLNDANNEMDVTTVKKGAYESQDLSIVKTSIESFRSV